MPTRNIAYELASLLAEKKQGDDRKIESLVIKTFYGDIYKFGQAHLEMLLRIDRANDDA